MSAAAAAAQAVMAGHQSARRMLAGAVLALLGLLAVGPAPAQAASADFSYSPEVPLANQPVTFVAQATGDSPVTSEWDLDGDDKVDASGKQVTTSYKTAGSYKVTLFVTAADGKAEKTREVTVGASANPRPVKPAPTNKAPVAAVTLAGPAPAAGSLARFSAARSSDPGGRIVAYEWDWNSDGRFDSNTGKNASASFLFAKPGSHAVGVRVTDDQGARDTAQISFSSVDPRAGCRSSVSVGPLEIAAACVRREGDRYLAETSIFSNQVRINGITLGGPLGRSERIVYDARRQRITSSAAFAVQIDNTPLVDIVLWRGELDWGLPDLAARGAQSAPAGGVRLVTLRAGAGCTAAERTICARLPGGFPLTGQIDLYATTGFQAVLDAWVELSRPFTVRGNVRLRTTPERGLAIDELGFRVANANLGAFRLETLAFRYQAPPADTWDAELRVVLPTPTRAGVAGRLRFVRGEFSFLMAELRGAEIPIAPGIFLNRFRGDFGLSPYRIGGGLGARFATAEANANFLFEDTTPPHIRAEGAFSLLGAELARARFDYWTNGDLDFGGELHYRYPPLASLPAVYRIDGEVAGWFQNPRFEVEGNVRLQAWIIDARVRAFLNNDWAAGCAGVEVPVAGRVEGKAALRLRDGHTEFGFGCDLGAYRLARLRARGSQAGAQTFTLPRGLPGAGIELRSQIAAPTITLRGPRGETFTASAPSGAIERRGPFTAVRTESDHRLVMRVDRPAAGTWSVIPAEGSPPVTQLRTAQGLPPARVDARVSGRGPRRKLAFKIQPLAGQRVRFLEDGADTTHRIGVATGARGTIRFTPADGSGRRRRIIAVIDQDGVPRARLTVARYTAPPPVRPGRPGRVSLSRRGARALIGWARAERATGYAIAIRGSDGRRELRLASRRARRLTIDRVLPSERLTVTVRGEYGPSHRTGPARTARLYPKSRRRGR